MRSMPDRGGGGDLAGQWEQAEAVGLVFGLPAESEQRLSSGCGGAAHVLQPPHRPRAAAAGEHLKRPPQNRRRRGRGAVLLLCHCGQVV